MNILKRFVTGLGNQTAPFGFAPNDPEAGYKAGLGYIGDVGANILANNQGGVDPFANLGASLQQAKQTSTQRNREQYTAQRLMEEAAMKRQEREQADAERMQREEFLKSLPPDVQMKARSVPGFLEAYVQATDPNLQKPERPNLTADMQNFLFAQENPEFAAHLQQGQGGDAKSYAPIPFKKADGTVGYGIPYGDGNFIEVPAPEGTSFLGPFDKAADAAFGKAQGESIAAAPSDIASADIALQKIDGLRSDPNRTLATGASSVFNVVPGTPGYDYQTKVDEVTAGAFLTAIQELRGMGALSNAEGQTATQAVTRLKTATTEQGFLGALADYEKIVVNGRERARRRLNRGLTPSTPAASEDNADPLGLR